MKKKQIKRNILTILEADKEMKLYTHMLKHMYGYNDIHHAHTHLIKMFKNRSDIKIDLISDAIHNAPHILITILEKTNAFGSTSCGVSRKHFFWDSIHTELAKTETGVYTCTINELKHVFCYPDIKTAVKELTSELNANGNENIAIEVYGDYIDIIDKNRTTRNHGDSASTFFKTQEMVSNAIDNLNNKWGYYVDSMSTIVNDTDNIIRIQQNEEPEKHILAKNNLKVVEDNIIDWIQYNEMSKKPTCGEPYAHMLFLTLIQSILIDRNNVAIISANELLEDYGYYSNIDAHRDMTYKLANMRGVRVALTNDGDIKLTRVKRVLRIEYAETEAIQHDNTVELKSEIFRAIMREDFESYRVDSETLIHTCGFISHDIALEIIQEWLKNIHNIAFDNNYTYGITLTKKDL